MYYSTYQTQYTSQIAQGANTPQRNMRNRKPFRTIRQKALAKEKHFKTTYGSWASNVPVSYHP